MTYTRKTGTHLINLLQNIDVDSCWIVIENALKLMFLSKCRWKKPIEVFNQT